MGRIIVGLSTVPSAGRRPLFRRISGGVGRSPGGDVGGLLGKELPRECLLFLLRGGKVSPSSRKTTVSGRGVEDFIGTYGSFRFGMGKALPLSGTFIANKKISIGRVRPRAVTSGLVRKLFFYKRVLSVRNCANKCGVASTLMANELTKLGTTISTEVMWWE